MFVNLKYFCQLGVRFIGGTRTPWGTSSFLIAGPEKYLWAN